MADPPASNKKLWSLKSRATAFPIVAGVALILLVLLQKPGPHHETMSVPLTSMQLPGTPHPTSTRIANVTAGNETSVSANEATPRAVEPSATVAVVGIRSTPTDRPRSTSTPTPIDAPRPTAIPSAVPANRIAPPTAEARPTTTPEPQSRVRRLAISTIGVDAPVEIKSVDNNGVMQAPSSANVVSWYDFSAPPGTEGNAVFAGHLDYAGVGPAVFWRLGQLQSGGEITVTDQDGRSFRYRVASVRTYSATTDASPIVASTGKPTITLITCDGTFNHDTGEYDERIVVTGDLID